MAIQHAYAITNKAAALAATAFTWSNGASTNRPYLADGRLDRIFAVGSVASSVDVVIDFGAAVELSAIAILNHNLATATHASVTVDAADVAFGVGNPYVTPKSATTVNTTAPRQKDTVLQFASTTKRYWRITFAWTGSFALTLGEIFACVTTTLTRAVVYGNQSRLEYVRSQFRSDSGETRGHVIAGPIRTRHLPFEDLSPSEIDELTAMFIATRGGVTAILWIEQYEATSTAADNAHQDVILGKFEDPSWGFSEADYDLDKPDDFLIRSLGREVGA